MTMEDASQSQAALASRVFSGALGDFGGGEVHEVHDVAKFFRGRPGAPRGAGLGGCRPCQRAAGAIPDRGQPDRERAVRILQSRQGGRCGSSGRASGFRLEIALSRSLQTGCIVTKHRIYTTSFASVYPHYVAKAEKKGRTKAEVDEIIAWLTGYGPDGIGGRAGRAHRLRDLLRQGAADEPGEGGDHGRDLRGAGGGDRGAADAGDTLSRQAGRRAGAGEKDGEDPAGGVGVNKR